MPIRGESLRSFYTRSRILLHFTGGLSARPGSLTLGNLHRSRHDLAFVVVVPARTRPGRYLGIGHLLRREHAHDYDWVGAPFYVVVRVVGVRPIAPVIRWQPADNLGTITVAQDQTVTETASFTSSVDVTDVEIKRSLSDYARDHGLSIAIGAPIASPSVAANTPMNVTFTLTARSDARPDSYPAALYVAGTEQGGPRGPLHNGLHFLIDLDRAPVAPTPVVMWSGGSYATFPSIARGSVVTETATFTASAGLSNAGLRLVYNRRLRGARITLVPLSSATIAANTPVTVSLTVDTTAMARSGFYAGSVYVVAQPANGSMPSRPLHYRPHFTGAVQ